MPKKVLIIDDDPHIQKYLESIFKDNGYVAVVASTGDEGYELLIKEKPDLITLDLDMPEGAGPSVYMRMRKEPELEKIPVVVISGLEGAHRAVKKAVATIGKPFDPESLIKLVKNTIG